MMRHPAGLGKRHRLLLGGCMTSLLIATALVGPSIVSQDPLSIALDQALAPPSLAHPLGRDALGRDLLARTVYGARVALLISFLGVILGASAGIMLGVWAGYAGGWRESVAMRLVDVLLAFPGFLLALVAATLLGPGTINLAVAVGFFSFPTFARVARAMTRSLKQELYVTAARSLGASDLWIFFRHLLRNAAGPLISLTALRMGLSLATASGLSFLGLGPPAPTPDWGSMLDAGREYLWLAPRLVLAPGAALFFSSLGLYLLGDCLRQPEDRP